MKASIFSFATEPLVIEATLLAARKISGGALCTASTGFVRKQAEKDQSIMSEKVDAAISVVIMPDQSTVFDFDLTLQKMVLGDRHPVAVDLKLEIGWRRQDSSEVNTTVLEAAYLVAPMAEPRVFLTISPVSLLGLQAAAYKLSFTFENPSMHFLTFNVSLQASEDFAFSGSKTCAISLVPISRQRLTYQILPSQKDKWIEVHLDVVDAYFGQTLKVLPGGKGVKVDRKGNVLVKV